MAYTVKKLSDLAGVSVRTLHYYDQIGLLKPCTIEANGYRSYGENELLKLQQILFFRELDFPLKEIKKILSSPHFDMRAALYDQRRLIELKKNRLSRLIKTIDKTIEKINQENIMDDQELFGGFTKEEMDRYTEEARKRWGSTDAFKQSQERVEKMGKPGIDLAMEKAGQITENIAECMKSGLSPESEAVQKEIQTHYDWLRNFYEPDLEIYRGLANLYVDDGRFKSYYEKFAPGLAEFMQDAMIAYCEAREDDK